MLHFKKHYLKSNTTQSYKKKWYETKTPFCRFKRLKKGLPNSNTLMNPWPQASDESENTKNSQRLKISPKTNSLKLWKQVCMSVMKRYSNQKPSLPFINLKEKHNSKQFWKLLRKTTGWKKK